MYKKWACIQKVDYYSFFFRQEKKLVYVCTIQPSSPLPSFPKDE